MCSVVGYIGKDYGRSFIIEGLSRLEYRGYDSAGFACLHPQDNRLLYCKAEGRLQNLTAKFVTNPIDGHIGIGHTRWSTHGKPTETNAHPQFDCEKIISVVHNGIIENHHQLKAQLLEDGHIFHSDTDTEIIAHLLESLLAKHADLKRAIVALVGMLEGAFSFICIMESYPDQMILVRKRSPLCIGMGNDEMFVASDVLAFADKTQKVLFLQDESFAMVKRNAVELYDFKGNVIPIMIHELSFDWEVGNKGGHKHFMLKEIYEQKRAIHATVEFLSSLSDDLWEHIGLSKEQIYNLERLSLIACGTSWHAARIAQFFFESICQIPTRVYLASEMRYMPFFKESQSLYIAISQSGETADTLEALRMINGFNLPTLALTNVASSTMVREADGFLLTQAGHEIAVASTKAFSTQLTALYWLAHRIAYEKKLIDAQAMEMAEDDLLIAAEVLENSIENYKFSIKQKLAPFYAQFKQAIFLGRHISYPFALEAALKLKEISYIFAQCYPAGELKHGPLALIDEHIPVFIFSCQDQVIYRKLVANAQEAKARGGHVVAFCFEGQKELIDLAEVSFIFPRCKPLLEPLAMSGLMQYFVYEIANVLGCEIDKPRNLAKSVTVE
jgi:glucosamine--fructose-6-phosphate aminotransferase (isomerizing)